MSRESGWKRHGCLRHVWVAALFLAALPALAAAAADIPTTPLLTVYQFNGPLAVPYYDVERFRRDQPGPVAGTLAQGTSLVACLVVHDGRPLTDSRGTPYVGFEVVVDAREATPAAAQRFTEVAKQRAGMLVANHHCRPGTRYVLSARSLYGLEHGPSFDPPPEPAKTARGVAGRGELDDIVRSFHSSAQCARANRRLMQRREALADAWDNFLDANRGRWPATSLKRARHLDYAMRTALYEGHLGRGCSAYGACERDVILLSIRNRAVERCTRGQGCRSAGDFEGVASTVSQYNIWDEYLTQTTAITGCFLRPDLSRESRYARLQAMYEQSVGDAENILYGSERDLQTVFPGTALSELTRLRHYYHPPAMGKCFPDHPRLEYITAAVAQRGEDFALLVNTRIEVDEARGDGYLFRQALVQDQDSSDVIRLDDRYPGFVIDGRAVQLERPTRCTAYGVSRTCRFERVGRYRKTPSWLESGDSIQFTCRVRARDETCLAPLHDERIKLGGTCDIEMQPVVGVP